MLSMMNGGVLQSKFIEIRNLPVSGARYRLVKI